MTELQAFKTEIGRLDREATAGPWETDFRYERMENIYGAAIVGPEGYLFSSEPDCGITEFEDETAFDSVARANALFIAYARTALPQLLALAEDLQARLTVAEDAL